MSRFTIPNRADRKAAHAHRHDGPARPSRGHRVGPGRIAATRGYIGPKAAAIRTKAAPAARTTGNLALWLARVVLWLARVLAWAGVDGLARPFTTFGQALARSAKRGGLTPVISHLIAEGLILALGVVLAVGGGLILPGVLLIGADRLGVSPPLGLPTESGAPGSSDGLLAFLGAGFKVGLLTFVGYLVALTLVRGAIHHGYDRGDGKSGRDFRPFPRLVLRKPVPVVKQWYAPLLEVLAIRGHTPKPAAGTEPVVATWHSKMSVVDPGGESVTIAMPKVRGASTAVEVIKDRSGMAAGIDLPTARLEITEGEHAGLVTFRRVNVRSSDPKLSTVAATGVTRWYDPVRIGEDSRGTPVLWRTWEENGLVGGAPGKGKTVTVRAIVAHYLQDPTAAVHLLDGKPSPKDWGAARHLYATYAEGSDPAAQARVKATFEGLLALIQQRNAVDPGNRPDFWRPDGVLCVVDELHEILAGVAGDQGKKARDELETLMGRVVRLGRSQGVGCVFITQRPTAESIPPGTAGLLTNRLAYQMSSTSELDFTLGQGKTGATRHPSGKGQALFTDGGDAVYTYADHFTQTAWMDLCSSLPDRRPAPAPVDEPVVRWVPPLLVEVTALLEASGEGRLTWAVINASLPAELRCTDAAQLSKKMNKLGLKAHDPDQSRNKWVYVKDADAAVESHRTGEQNQQPPAA